MQIDVAGASGDGRTASLLGLRPVRAGRDRAQPGPAPRHRARRREPGQPRRGRALGGYGAAYTLALTYDWFLGNRRTGGWALTPGLRLRAVPSETVDAFAAWLGLEICYWSGLPRNQLALPDSEAYSSRCPPRAPQ